MTIAPEIDVRDLASVRRAAAALGARPGTRAQARQGTTQILLGEEWVRPERPASAEAAGEARPGTRRRRGLLSLWSSPLARKIFFFNLVGLCLLVAGMLCLAPGPDNFAFDRATRLIDEAELVADVFEAQLRSGDGERDLAASDPAATLRGLDLASGIELMVFDAAGRLVARWTAPRRSDAVAGLEGARQPTFLGRVVRRGTELAARLDPRPPAPTQTRAEIGSALAARALGEGTVVEPRTGAEGDVIFAASPIRQGGTPIGAVAVINPPGEIDALLLEERERLLVMFCTGLLISLVLSLLLASSIANPIAELAAAAEAGRERDARKMAPDRIRIPDLTARPDEIGRLSGAMRGMVAALYERIESNEQFAADVAHEIKNPLASLRSAVGTLQVVRKDEQRQRMLEVIEHDLQRLDRLVTDISSASRLDSELVREDEMPLDLLKLIGTLSDHLGRDAQSRGIDFVCDLPKETIIISGLEGRLAQVFVNIVGNAISFCEDGDAIRVWARRRGSRVLVVVEDTGPGIPESALTRIFQRFYSERPEQQFGNNSGLGLAISRQIVEAHGGVIWAENIRPTDADPTSEPLGARFVVGLPV